MTQVIRVLVVNPFTQSTLVVGLERPLEWNVVLREFFQAIHDCDDEPEATRYDNCKIFLHPSKSTKEKGVVIRKANLDRSIRDGDLLSVQGLVNVQQTESAAPAPPTNGSSLSGGSDILDVMDSIDIDIDSLNELNETAPSQANAVVSSSSLAAMRTLSSAPTSSNSINTTASVSMSRKNKRGRSLSSKFWLVNKLANNGRINKEQKDMLKLFLIACDDYTINQAFEKYEETGDLEMLLNVPTKSMRRQLGDINASLSTQPEVSLTQNMKDELQLLSSEGHDPTSFGSSQSHPHPQASASSLLADGELSHEINPLDEFSSLLDLPVPLGYEDAALAPGIAQDLQGFQEWLN